MLSTHFGSGICSHKSRRRGPILTETVPATIIKSAWRGLERKTSEPNLDMSYCAAEAAAIISLGHKASPYPSGHTERERDQFLAQFNISATLVSCTGPSCSPGIYSNGPLAIGMGTALCRVPGTSPCLSPLSVLSIVYLLHLFHQRPRIRFLQRDAYGFFPVPEVVRQCRRKRLQLNVHLLSYPPAKVTMRGKKGSAEGTQSLLLESGLPQFLLLIPWCIYT